MDKMEQKPGGEANTYYIYSSMTKKHFFWQDLQTIANKNLQKFRKIGQM